MRVGADEAGISVDSGAYRIITLLPRVSDSGESAVPLSHGGEAMAGFEGPRVMPCQTGWRQGVY